MRAEFFGILGVEPLPDTVRPVFERLREAYAAQTPSVLRHSHALVGACARRAQGRAVVRSGDGLGLVLAGDPDRAWDACDLAGIRKQLLAGERPTLLHRQPPTAMCFIDEADGRAWLLGDRFGLVPVHVARQDGLVFFSSRLEPLLTCGAVDTRLDREAVLSFFTFEHLTGDKTLHEHVKVLPAAGRIVLSPAGCDTDVYAPGFVPAEQIVEDISLDQAAHAIDQGLRAAVEEAVRRSDTVAVTLSGGLDSRAVLGFAKAAGADLRTYTFGQPGSRDALLAEAVARAADVPHSFLPLDGSFLPRWLDHAVGVSGGAVGAHHIQILALLDRVSAEAGAVLDGLGGDMLTGGHLSWRLAAARTRERAVDLVLGMHATGTSTEHARTDLFEEAFLRGVSFDPREAIRAHTVAGAPPWRTGHSFDAQERQRRFIQYGPQLYRHAIDVYTPFYAGDLPENLQRLPLRMLMEQRGYVQMHRRSLPQLARIRDAARGIPLSWPQEVRFAKRVADAASRRAARVLRLPGDGAPGTTDYAVWFRTSCRGLLEERLLDGGDVLEGVIRRGAVERHLREHMAGQHDHSHLLGNLLSFASWLQRLRADRMPVTEATSIPRPVARAQESRVGVVAIGRNEGERLARCLDTLDTSLPTVYVDSGSTDNSVSMASAHGVDVVELDRTRPFSAARARNEGLDRLMEFEPDLAYVQFIDSDCELDPGWIRVARRFLDDHPDVAVVCGRRRELHPERSVYIRLADMEWNTPVGDAFTCGGDSMMRADVVQEAGAFDAALIAGEEPDLCLRIRRAGHRVVRIDHEMTLHDVDITRFSQWWRRAARWGHGYTEMVVQHGRTAERRWVRSLISCVAWGLVLPGLALLLATVTRASLLLLLAYLLPLTRVYLTKRVSNPRNDAAAYAVSCVLGKFAEAQGAVSCLWNRVVMKRRSSLIEYKNG